MTEVEKVKQICKERKIPISKLEKACGFCNGYIGQLKKGVFPSDRLLKVAAYLGVPLSKLSSTAADLSYVADADGITVDIEITKALSGPYREHLLAYARKLNELRKMEEE